MRARRNAGPRRVVTLPLKRAAGMNDGVNVQRTQAVRKIGCGVIERYTFVYGAQRSRGLCGFGGITASHNQRGGC